MTPGQRSALFSVSVAVLVGLTVAAVLAYMNGSEPETLTQAQLDQRAERLVTTAAERAAVREPGCRPGSGPRSSPRPTRGTPDSSLVDSLSVLRRKGTASERALVDSASRARLALPYPADRLFTDATRVIVAPDRKRFVLAAGRTDQRGYAPKLGVERCGVLRREALDSLAQDEPDVVRDEAVRLSGELTKVRQPSTTLAVTRYPGDARVAAGGGPFDGATFERDGILVAGSTSEGLAFHALVPDGVDSVTAVYGNGRQSLPAQVRHNLAALTGPATGPTTYPTSTVWRDRAGKVVRTVEHEVLPGGAAPG